MKSYRKKIAVDSDGRYDVTPIFSDTHAFDDLVEDLIEPFVAFEFDYVVGIDDIGFVIATAMARRLGKGFVTVRRTDREGKNSKRATFIDWYGNPKVLELKDDALTAGSKVLLVDEWIETGQQVRATLQMFEELGVETIGISAIHAQRNNETDDLFEYYELHSALIAVE